MDGAADERVPRQLLERYERLCLRADVITGMPREVWTKTRQTPCPLVRRVIMMCLSNAGHSYNTIGRVMGCGHSNISIAMSRMADDMMAGERATMEMMRLFAGRYGFINVSQDNGTVTAGTVYGTREEALENSTDNTINTIMIQY